MIRNNIILRASWDGIRSQPHEHGVPSNLVITHNRVLAPTQNALTVLSPSNNAVRSNAIASCSVVVANNALFAEVGNAIQVSGELAEIIVTNNAGAGGTSGIDTGFNGDLNIARDLQEASYGGLPQVVFQSDRSSLIDVANPAYAVAVDFNGTPRQGVTLTLDLRMADRRQSWWRLAEAFKSPPAAQ